MRSLFRTTPIALLLIAYPAAVLANVNSTVTMNAPGQEVSLDSGAVVLSGGDLLWNGTGLVPQGNATVFNVGTGGTAAANNITQTVFSAFPASLFSSQTIQGSALAQNEVLAVKTNGGNDSLVVVQSVGNGSITLVILTYETGTGTPTGPTGPTIPTISQVLNNYGLVPSGFVNSGIAQGSLFIVKGTNLANTTNAVLQSSAAPGLPVSLNGASVKVTSGGTIVTPVFYYAIATQLALVLPSNTPVGTATLVVTYGGQASAAFSFQVVPSAMQFAAFYGTGSGLGAAINPATYTPYTYGNSIPPGTTVILYGSGLGADPTRDVQYVANSATSTINGLAHVYVGGEDAPIQYQGAFGYPGVNQVNVTIPADAATGCNVSVVGVSASGVPTNFITLPIGNGPCTDPAFGNSGATLTTLSNKTTVNTGFVFLDQSVAPTGSGGTQTSNIALADFQSVTGASYGTSSGAVSLGSCEVLQNLTSSGSTSTSTPLSAGTITITGPAGSATLTPVGSVLPGYYEAQLPINFISSSGGSFAVNATAGSQVGAFNTSINYPNPILTWTNQTASATITRSSGATITWNGGSSGTFVEITGSSSSGTLTGSFTCLAPVSPAQFTIPSYVLSALPAGTGGLTVGNYTNFTTFQATGLDYGYAAGFVAYDITASYK